MIRTLAAIALSLFLCSAALAQSTPAATPPAAPRTVPDFSMPPIAGATLEAQVRGLIYAIEDKPSGVIINNAGYIQKAPTNQPYNADGSRNENFRVTPDLSGAQASYALNGDQRRQRAYDELVRIGRPAVPLLCMAVVMEAYEQRSLYVKALGEIRDPRAVPALTKYMEDGKMMVSMSSTMVSVGNTVEAKRLDANGKKMMADSADALFKITGQNYGNDLPRWRAWWEQNKAQVKGPVPPIQLYKVGTTTPVPTAAPAAPTGPLPPIVNETDPPK